VSFVCERVAYAKELLERDLRLVCLCLCLCLCLFVCVCVCVSVNGQCAFFLFVCA
jgi:hypothetical protein